MKASYSTLYLFDNVFFPETIIPLSVSDITSMQIIKDAFKKNEPIILCHPSERPLKIGTLGKVLLIDSSNDAKVSAIIQGIARVKLGKLTQEFPYHRYENYDYNDQEDDIPPSHEQIENLNNIFESWLARNIESKHERVKFLKEITSPSKLVDCICLLMIQDLAIKDMLLESTSLNERIRLLSALLPGERPEIEDPIIAEAIKSFEQITMNKDLSLAV